MHDNLGSFGLVFSKNPRVDIDDRHRGTEPRESLSQFAPDRPGTNDRERGRPHFQIENGFVGQGPEPSKTVDLRHARPGAGGDDGFHGAQCSVADSDCMSVHERSIPEIHVHPGRSVAIHRVVDSDGRPNTTQPPECLAKGFLRIQVRIARPLGRVQQRLRWHATDV